MTIKSTILLGQPCTMLTEPPLGKSQLIAFQRLYWPCSKGRGRYFLKTCEEERGMQSSHRIFLTIPQLFPLLQLTKDSGEQALPCCRVWPISELTVALGSGGDELGEQRRQDSHNLQRCLLFSWSLIIRKQQPTQACEGSFRGKQLLTYSPLALWAESKKPQLSC